MHRIESINEMQSHAVSLRTQGKLIGLVPTISSLHEGQLSLVELARERSDVVVVSIFNNPARFVPSEGVSRAWRNIEEDVEVCEKHGVDMVFAPSTEELFPNRFSTYVAEEDLSAGMCGASMPQYFREVCTEIAKLFNIVRPDLAVLGQKDAQQAAIIKKMVDDLHFPIDILVGPTVREEDGIAMGARNRLLSGNQRTDAAAIYGSLCIAQKMVNEGVRNVDRLMAEITHELSQRRRLRVIYVTVVHHETLKPLREIVPGESLIAVAAWCDEVRLIDNVIV